MTDHWTQQNVNALTEEKDPDQNHLSLDVVNISRSM